MKKIIAAFDSLKFSESTLAYSIMLGRQLNAHLVAVFMNDITYSSYNRYKILAEAGDDVYMKIERLDNEDEKCRNTSEEKFAHACSEASLNFSIHKDKGIALLELLHESVYADLVIIDAHETCNRYTEAPPTRFVRDFLAGAQCPVLLVPKFYVPLKKSVLLYDGNPSSVYAVKMFSYLLPVLNALPAEVITVKNEESDLHLPDNKLMKEFMKRHSPDAVYTVLKGLPEAEIIKHLRLHEEAAIVVAGAYDRNVVSRFFHPSMADMLAAELKWPLFIAHQ